MNKFLSALSAPFKWIGVATHEVSVWLPKIIGIAAYTESEAKVLTPAFVKLVDGVEQLSTLVVKDGGITILAVEELVTSLAAFGGAGALNPATYSNVISAVSKFITLIHNNPDWSKMFAIVKQIALDYDALGADVKTALAKSESILGIGSGATPAPVAETTVETQTVGAAVLSVALGGK